MKKDGFCYSKYRYGQCSKCSRVSGAFLAQLAQFVQGTGFHSEVPLQAKTSVVERYQRYNKAQCTVTRKRESLDST